MGFTARKPESWPPSAALRPAYFAATWRRKCQHVPPRSRPNPAQSEDTTMVAVCSAATSATDAAAISTSLVADGDGVHVCDGVGVTDGVRDAESADALGVTEPLTLTLLLSRADLLGDREATADRDGETDADVL
jgi:hypothetical protein